MVVGATGAIGRKLAFTILQKGGTPVLVGRSADKLATLNEELGGSCPLIVDIDFSGNNPAQAGAKLAEHLKGETLQGLACEYSAV